MNRTRSNTRRHGALIALSALLLACIAAQGQSTWDGSQANGLWNDADNWTPSGVPNGNTARAVLDSTGSGRAIDLGGVRVVLGDGTTGLTDLLKLDDSTNGYTIGNGTLSFYSNTSGGGNVNILVTGSHTIDASLDMGNAAYSMANSKGVIFTGTSSDTLTINSPNITGAELFVIPNRRRHDPRHGFGRQSQLDEHAGRRPRQPAERELAGPCWQHPPTPPEFHRFCRTAGQRHP